MVSSSSYRSELSWEVAASVRSHGGTLPAKKEIKKRPFRASSSTKPRPGKEAKGAVALLVEENVIRADVKSFRDLVQELTGSSSVAAMSPAPTAHTPPLPQTDAQSPPPASPVTPVAPPPHLRGSPLGPSSPQFAAAMAPQPSAQPPQAKPSTRLQKMAPSPIKPVAINRGFRAVPPRSGLAAKSPTMTPQEAFALASRGAAAAATRLPSNGSLGGIPISPFAALWSPKFFSPLPVLSPSGDVMWCANLESPAFAAMKEMAAGMAAAAASAQRSQTGGAAAQGGPDSTSPRQAQRPYGDKGGGEEGKPDSDCRAGGQGQEGEAHAASEAAASGAAHPGWGGPGGGGGGAFWPMPSPGLFPSTAALFSPGVVPWMVPAFGDVFSPYSFGGSFAPALSPLAPQGSVLSSLQSTSSSSGGGGVMEAEMMSC